MPAGDNMHRIAATLAVLLLASCASGTYAWAPNRFAAPRGVSDNMWGACWRLEESEALRLESYRAMTPKQKWCTLLRATAQCVRDKKEVFRRSNPEDVANCDWRAFDEAVEDADNDECSDPDEGLAQVVDKVVGYLNGQRRSTPSSLNRSGEMCPAQ